MTGKQKSQAWDWYDKIIKGLLFPAICFAAYSYVNLEKTMIKIRADVIHVEQKTEGHVKSDEITDIADVREAMRDS